MFYPDTTDGIAWYTADDGAWARYAAGRYAAAAERRGEDEPDDETS